MILVNELRIGNMVNIIDRSGEVHLPLRSITHYIHGIVDIFNVKVSVAKPFDPHHDGKPFEISLSDVEPIDITGKRLKEFGFEKLQGKIIRSFDKRIKATSAFSEMLSLSLDDNLVDWFVYFRQGEHYALSLQHENDIVALRKIRHMHHLQNTFFNLTGTEL